MMDKHYYESPDYGDEEYISEEELARSEGFYLDDDGHWVPLDDELMDGLGYAEPDEDDDFYDDCECMNEIDFARSEGFYVDDDGHWIPEEDADW